MADPLPLLNIMKENEMLNNVWESVADWLEFIYDKIRKTRCGKKAQWPHGELTAVVVDGEVQTWKVEVDDDLQAASPTQATYTISGLSNDNATEDETVHLLTSAGSVTENGVTSHNLHLTDSVTATMPEEADRSRMRSTRRNSLLG